MPQPVAGPCQQPLLYVASASARPPTQVITGSHDSTIRLWDIRTGKTLSTLTFHKKRCALDCGRGLLVCAPLAGLPSAVQLLCLLPSPQPCLPPCPCSVRAMTMHPEQHAFASASADNISEPSAAQEISLHLPLQRRAHQHACTHAAAA